MENSMPIIQIPLAFSIIILILHSNLATIKATSTTTTTTVVTKDQTPCTVFCTDCENPCQPLPPPPPPVVVECPPPPSPPAPNGPECPPPPGVGPPVPPSPDFPTTPILPIRPPIAPYDNSPPVSYFPNFIGLPLSTSLRLRIHEPAVTSICLFLAFLCLFLSS